MTYSYRHAASLLCFMVLFITQAAADPLPEPWQSRRVEVNKITDKACSGDKKAVAAIWSLARDQNDPVAQNNLSWLSKNCGNFKLSAKERAGWLRKSAMAGYPVGMNNYANKLMKGEGVAQDVKAAVSLHERAIKGGMGTSAVDLAYYLSNGKYLPRNLEKAEAYLKLAEREGVAKSQLDKTRKTISTARTQMAAKQSTNSANQTGAKPQKQQFAALVVSMKDGGLGWAHDYPNQQEAEKRALQECRQKGGKDCQVKMVGYGKGCMAYHYAGGSATAHGWSMGRTRAAVEARAAEECRKRNNNKTCPANGWVCNDRTEAPFTVAYEASMPAMKEPASAGGVACNFYVYYDCQIPGQKLQTTFTYESYRTGKKLQFPGFSSCKDARKEGKVIYRGDGKTGGGAGMPEVFELQQQRIIGLVNALRSAVNAKFPGCKPKYNYVTSRYLEVGIGYDNKSTLTSKPTHSDRHVRKDGTIKYFWINLE